ncbi:hypothetical protein HZH68_013466 [Vespula germanica]|uniref:Uncharacterized protein n=1 Tax=Vespula germanica TaxID=30212 RepID=A0A834JDE5_VESGE|nr:hypothetical protein HZH68_013466 [Vespula germanica]
MLKLNPYEEFKEQPGVQWSTASGGECEMLCRVPRMPIKRNFSEEEKEEEMVEVKVEVEEEEDQTRETSAAAIATVAAAATPPTAAATATAIVATSGTASSSGKSLLKSNIPVVSTLFYKSKMILPMGWTVRANR